MDLMWILSLASVGFVQACHNNAAMQSMMCIIRR